MIMDSIISNNHIVCSRMGIKSIHKIMMNMIILKNNISCPNRVESKAIVMYFIIFDYTCTIIAIIAQSRTPTTAFIS